MCYEISFSQNYYLKPNPVSLQCHDIISIQKALRLFPSTQTQNNLEWILFWRNTISIFRMPPEDANSKFLRNTATQTTCYRNLHHIVYSQLWKTEAKKPSGWFMQEKLNYKYHIMFWTNIAWCNVAALFALHLRYGFYCLVKWSNKLKGYSKTKNWMPFRNAKFYELYIYVDGFTVNKTTQDICKSQNKNETNITTTLAIEHNKF